MLNRKSIGLAAATLAIVPTTVLGLGATGASAAPLPAATAVHAKCTDGISDGNTTTCIEWSNTGRHVDFVTGTATIHHAARTLEVLLRGPHGAIKISPRGFVHVGRGDTITVNWVPKATEPAGYYCVQTWRENSNRTATEIGDVCAFIG